MSVNSAAALAYMTWAFALPDSPFTEYGWYSSAVSSLAMLLVSTILRMIAPLFRKELTTSTLKCLVNRVTRRRPLFDRGGPPEFRLP